MTTIYQWFSFPNSFSVKCPECGSECRCLYEPIYKFKQVGGTMISSLKWESGTFKGDLSCLGCGLNVNSTINWPEDAFWKFYIKGKVLWAWSLEHSKVLLTYIQSRERNEFNCGGYAASLFHLPEHFKLAKNREAAIKSINKVLEKCT